MRHDRDDHFANIHPADEELRQPRFRRGQSLQIGLGGRNVLLWIGDENGDARTSETTRRADMVTG
jgi:hypothetical protein